MAKKNKRKKIEEIIEVPEGVEVTIEEGKVKMKKGDEEVEKKIVFPIENKDNKLIVKHEKPNKSQKKLIKTMAAHLQNMVRGLENKYEYKLKVCSVHFPMNVEVKGNEVTIKNFLGGTIPRKAKILDGVDVNVQGEEITVTSSDKEKAGQTAANIEKASVVKGKDRRVFQDGCFITKKEKGRKVEVLEE